MTPETFRRWLAERGCTFEQHESERGGGHVSVTVRREGRRAELPLASTRQDLDPDIVNQIVDTLGLNRAELPGPSSRV